MKVIRRAGRRLGIFVLRNPMVFTLFSLGASMAVATIILIVGQSLNWGEEPLSARVIEKQLLDQAEAERQQVIGRVMPTIPKRYGASVEKTTDLTLDEKDLGGDVLSVCKHRSEESTCETLQYGEESFLQNRTPELEYWLNIVHQRRRSHYWLHLRQSFPTSEGEVSWAGNYAIEPGEAVVFTFGPDEFIRVARAGG